MCNNTLSLGPWEGPPVVWWLFNNLLRVNGASVQGEPWVGWGAALRLPLPPRCVFPPETPLRASSHGGRVEGRGPRRQKWEKQQSLGCSSARQNWLCAWSVWSRVRGACGRAHRWDAGQLRFKSCTSARNQAKVTPLSQHPLTLLVRVQLRHVSSRGRFTPCCTPRCLLWLPSVVSAMVIVGWWQNCKIPDCACVPEPTTIIRPPPPWSQAAGWDHRHEITALQYRVGPAPAYSSRAWLIVMYVCNC